MQKTQKTKFLYGDKSLFTEYQITNYMAKGNNVVYQTVHKQEKEDIQCVKQIRLLDKNSQNIFQKQVKLLDKIKQNRHPYIIDFKGYYVIEQKSSQFNVFKKGMIQMEKGIASLNLIIDQRIKNNNPFTDVEIINFITSMIEAHRHLQSLEIAHRDIKPENIIVVNLEPLQYKICDVGVGTAVGNQNTKTRTLIGTVSYLSYQLFKAYREGRYSINYNPYKSDVYSLGLVIIYFCSLKKFTIKQRAQNQQQKILKIIKEIKNKYKSVIGLSKTLKSMMRINQNQRCDFIQLSNFITFNSYIRLKYDGFKTTNAGFYKNLQESGYLQINKIQQLPQIQMYTQNGTTIHSLQIKLGNLNKSVKQMQTICEQIRKIKSFNLKQLELNLQLNSIQQNAIKNVCEGIQKNVNLEQLYIYFWNNKLRDKGFSYVMDIFKKVNKLRILYLSLSYNQLLDKNVAEKIKSLQNLSSIKSLTLDLGLNSLSSQCIPYVLQSISKLSTLQKLYINFESNRVTPLSLKNLPNFFSTLNHLQMLSINLSGNQIKDQGLYVLADLAMNLQNLRSYQLILWNSQIKDKGLSQFMKVLSACEIRLIELRLILWNNQITEKGIQNFSSHILKLQKLEKLHLSVSNNKIGDNGIRILNKSIIQLHNLTEIKLGLDSTLCTPVGCRYIGRMLSVQKNLRNVQITLRANLIKLEGLQFIVTGLKQLKKLSHLNLVLEGCQVGDEGILLLNKILGRLKQLEVIYLNLMDCSLFDDVMYTLLHALKSNMDNVKQLSIDFRKNNISSKAKQSIKMEIANDKRIQLKFDDQ